jgi:hypothetical protein
VRPEQPLNGKPYSRMVVDHQNDIPILQDSPICLLTRNYDPFETQFDPGPSPLFVMVSFGPCQ